MSKKSLSMFFAAILSLAPVLLCANATIIDRIPGSSQFVVTINSAKIMECPLIAPLLGEASTALQASGLTIEDLKSDTALGVELKSFEKEAYILRVINKFNKPVALKAFTFSAAELKKSAPAELKFKEINKRSFFIQMDAKAKGGFKLINNQLTQAIITTENTDIFAPLVSGNKNIMHSAISAFGIKGKPALVIACDAAAFPKSSNEIPPMVKSIQFAALVLDTIGTDKVSLNICASCANPAAATQLKTAASEFLNQQMQAPNIPPFLKNLQVNSNGNNVALSITCTYTDIMSAIGTAMQMFQAPGTAQPQTPAAK